MQRRASFGGGDRGLQRAGRHRRTLSDYTSTLEWRGDSGRDAREWEDGGEADDAPAVNDGFVGADGRDGARRDGADGAMPDGSDGAPAAVNLEIVITRDVDDCTWINTTDERLHYDADSLYGEVGADTEAGRTGLRFVLPVPKGATINSAILELHRIIGDALDTETMQVQVFDSADVPPFDEAHVHAPAGHAAVWATSIRNIGVGVNGMPVTTPDLKLLVQHVIDRSDWTQGGAIGLVLSPDVMGVRWVDYADSSLGIGQPTLRVRYTR
jgi:hypothetical protein